MAYGPLAQCAFMSGPSPFKKKAGSGVLLLSLGIVGVLSM